MKKLSVILLLALTGIGINAQGVFTWKTSDNKPSAISWDSQGFSGLYKFDGSSSGCHYLLFMSGESVSNFNLLQGEGAYVRLFVPPGVNKVSIGHNDETLNASQCVKYTKIEENTLDYTLPAQTSGSEVWQWGCGSFNLEYQLDINNINQERVIFLGYYNEDNMHTNGVNFQDYTYTYYVSDSTIYNNWLNGTTNIKTFDKNKQIFVYPNPAENYIVINNLSDNNRVKILDITGKVLFNVDAKNNDKVQIDITSLKSGVYFVKEGNFVVKFIKK